MQPDSAEIKCVVWDLDGTVWDGVFLERDDREEITPRADVLAMMERLDAAGVVNSVASRTASVVETELRRLPRLWALLVAPQLSWGPKSESIRAIAETLGISTSSMLLVDDSPFERAEVLARCPGVQVTDRREALAMFERGDRMPRDLSPDARRRVDRYRAELRRQEAGAQFSSLEDFLWTTLLKLTIRPAVATDTVRISELVRRTRRLNSSGLPLPVDAAEKLVSQPGMLVAELQDRFGDYGLIGLTVVEANRDMWWAPLIAMSCRVQGRGVAPALLDHVTRVAAEAGATSFAVPLRPSDGNTELRVLLRQLGFSGIRDGSPPAPSGAARALLAAEPGSVVWLVRQLGELPAGPSPWVSLEADDSWATFDDRHVGCMR